MEQNYCKNCKHYRQHYVRLGKGYTEVDDGHCVHPRIKQRKTTTPACQHFCAGKRGSGCEEQT